MSRCHRDETDTVEDFDVLFEQELQEIENELDDLGIFTSVHSFDSETRIAKVEIEEEAEKPWVAGVRIEREINDLIESFAERKTTNLPSGKPDFRSFEHNKEFNDFLWKKQFEEEHFAEEEASAATRKYRANVWKRFYEATEEYESVTFGNLVDSLRVYGADCESNDCNGGHDQTDEQPSKSVSRIQGTLPPEAPRNSLQTISTADTIPSQSVP